MRSTVSLRTATALVLLAAMPALSGCGSGTRTGTGTRSGGARGPHSTAAGGPRQRGTTGFAAGRRPAAAVAPAGTGLSGLAPASLRRGALPPAGTTQRVDAAGAELAVTLRQVLDPLRASGAELPPHMRAVGVIVQIRSSGPRLYDSSATGDISLLSSAGVGMPVLATRGPCRTPLNDFDRYITAGEDRIGCVVFAVADGATLDAVRFSPHARRHGRLTWAP